MSKLGQEIKRVRREYGLSQSDLGSKAGLDASAISRIESGANPEPSMEHLQKIAQVLDINLVQLMSRLSSESTDLGPLKIVVTHSIWSAPFIVLFMEYGDLFPEIEFASYRTKDGPVWIRQNAGTILEDKSKCPPCPSKSALRSSDETEDVGYKPTFTAKEARMQLVNNETDCAVAASEAIGDVERLRPCLQIAHVAVGCSVLAIYKGEPINQECYTLTQFLSAIAQKTRDPAMGGSSQVPVVYAPSTIGVDHYKVLNEYKIEGISFTQVPVNLGDLRTLIDSICKRLENSEAVLLLAWQPQISWVMSLLKEDEARTCFGELQFMERSLGLLLANKEPENKLKDTSPMIPDFTHDLIFDSKSERWRNFVKNGSVETLANLLQNAIHDINEAETSGDPVIVDIANYLDIAPDVCLQALRTCGFSLRYHPKYLSFLKELD